MPEQSFFAELRKRKVVQAAAIYGAVAWGVTEIVVTIVEQLFLPQWVSTLAVIFFVVGFPIAMFLSWTFDLTAAGVQRTTVSSRRGTTSIVLSMALLVAGTAGLFFLIKPELVENSKEAVAADIAPQSVAVLPFDYSGLNPDDSYLGSGLSDELRDQLGRVEGLGIAARSSSIAAAQKGVGAKSMAQLLGVATILEGSMRRRGNVLTVSVALIDGKSGLAIWNDIFKRGPRELLNVQQEIAEAVVRETMPDSDQIIVETATQDATANELMILARHYEQQALEIEDMDPVLLQRAVELYRDATEADPESALAHSRLAVAQMFLGDIDAAGVSASKALDLDPSLAEAHHAYGKFLFATANERMGDELARAVKLNPNLPDALADYAFWYWFNVGADGVTELYERALKLDRLNVSRYAALGRAFALNDRPDDARRIVDQMIVLFDGAAGYRAIAEVLSILGDVDHSIAWTIKARNAQPDNPLHRQRLAEFYTDIGAYETAQVLEPDLGVGLLFKMRRYDEMIEKGVDLYWDNPDDVQLQIYLATAYNAKGRYNDALRMIEGSGVLDTYQIVRRSTLEFDAHEALLNAAYGSGEVEKAREFIRLAQTNHYQGDSANWWLAIGIACRYAISGDDDEVYRRLARAREGKHLAWEPMLKDAACFERFANDPEYLKTVRHFDDLRAMLRNRLPDTLAQHGVSLN
jgi:TolB-like protein/Tfp pilus assembly protein PilF